jgi:predicted transposase/invertase (TIGR01784 family)
MTDRVTDKTRAGNIIYSTGEKEGAGQAMKRKTLHIFDMVLKQLLHLSAPAIIQFINGLFDADHPLDSTVEYPNTETVTKKLRRLLSDTVVIIGGVHVYHLEAEISDDANMAIRVFEYGFAEALRTKTVSDSGEKISIRFPNARVLYWETTGKTPDEVTLALEFPEGGCYDYMVRSFKFLDHEIKELEAQKMTILLPFYVLKLRKKVVQARTTRRRLELSAEMKAILDELVLAVDRGEMAGLMSEPDKRIVLDHMEQMYRELFEQYSEFKEADTMLQDRLMTYEEKAELRGIEKGREEGRKEIARKLLANGASLDFIAQNCDLPLDTIKGMMN